MARRKDPGPLPTARKVEIRGAKGARHLGFVRPQLATLKDNPPRGDSFIHEIKFDGYRLQAHLRGGFFRTSAETSFDEQAFRPQGLGHGKV